MNNSIRNIQLVAVVVVLISTIIAFFLEMREMYENRDITLADLLLMFIYIEVIGLVRSYWETRAVRITYPLVIAITALARFIILQDKESDPTNLIYISVAIGLSIPFTLKMIPIWIIYSLLSGTTAMGFWVIAHECGHGAFSKNKTLETLIE